MVATHHTCGNKISSGKDFFFNLHNNRLLGALRERENFTFGNWVDGEVINQDEDQRKKGRNWERRYLSTTHS